MPFDSEEEEVVVPTISRAKNAVGYVICFHLRVVEADRTIEEDMERK